MLASAITSGVKENLDILVQALGVGIVLWHIAESKAKIYVAIDKVKDDAKDATRNLKDDLYSTIAQIDKRVDLNAMNCTIATEQNQAELSRSIKRFEGKVGRIERSLNATQGFLAKHSTFVLRDEE